MKMPTRRSMSVAMLMVFACVANQPLLAESVTTSPQHGAAPETGVAKQFLRDVWRTLRVNTPKSRLQEQRPSSPTVVAGLRGSATSSTEGALQPYWKDELEVSREFNDAVLAFGDAHFLLENGDFDSAENALLSFIDNYPSSPLRANALLALGLVYGERGEEARSVQILSQLGGTRNSKDPMQQAAAKLMESMM